MALDGITVAGIVSELNQKLIGGRIDKIYQPLSDEILFTVRSIGENFKVLVSANSNHPRIHITQIQKENPISPPMFCMVMRKYIAGGKITKIYQPDFERIIVLEVEAMNELGDITAKKLILEMMGKYSNFIVTDENNKILDAIKRVSHDKSSVREVLPGKEYCMPPSQHKQNPIFITKEHILKQLDKQSGAKVQEVLYKSYTGISPIFASEICFRADIEPSYFCEQLTQQNKETLFTVFYDIVEQIKKQAFSPYIYYELEKQKLLDFSVIDMKQFQYFSKQKYETISALLEKFYAEKDNLYHVRQKSYDMRRILNTNIERCAKKKEIQKKTETKVAAKDIWKVKGELLTANIHSIPKGVTTFRTVNFYDVELKEIDIAIDPTKTPAENAQKYFSKYNKAKRTLAALEIQKKQNDEELIYLESILNSLQTAKEEADLDEIRTELAEQGYMKRKTVKKNKSQKQKKAKPLHYISSDGFDIYVGKSNIQNDELTLRFAQSNDIWLHTKEIPGSHVIIKTNGIDIPNQTLLEAANLSAYFSKSQNSSQVPVDYTFKKFVKKPNGAKPGMVIYEKYKTIYITPNETMVKNLKNKSLF